jgi:hypothetical protein
VIWALDHFILFSRFFTLSLTIPQGWNPSNSEAQK